MHLPREAGYKALELSVQHLLDIIEEEPRPSVLWSLQYSRKSAEVINTVEETTQAKTLLPSGVLQLSDLEPDLAFADGILQHVRNAWQKVTGNSEGFMQFENREHNPLDDDEDSL